jgi:hypothetical protein
MPQQADPGNFWLVSLRNSPVASSSTFVSWITNGPSAADLASFGLTGLQATPATPATMYGGPVPDSAAYTALSGIIGQPRVLPIYSTYSGGATPTYQVVRFVGATVVDVKQNGTQSYVAVQLAGTIDPSATLTSGPGSTRFVYKGISLTR